MVYNVYCVNLRQPLLENRFMRLQRVKLMLCICDAPEGSLLCHLLVNLWY